MPLKRITVTSETESGRNKYFRDNLTGISMSRAQFVNAIESDEYPDYHVRIINGVKTPVSNPDPSNNNNLG
ncbi:hypothetical protein GBN25_02990 [Plesiomonas shigelloides]|nr:hypothetical protein GBN25_02990 [Plesiomonas shigelloides]